MTSVNNSSPTYFGGTVTRNRRRAPHRPGRGELMARWIFSAPRPAVASARNADAASRRRRAPPIAKPVPTDPPTDPLPESVIAQPFYFDGLAPEHRATRDWLPHGVEGLELPAGDGDDEHVEPVDASYYTLFGGKRKRKTHKKKSKMHKKKSKTHHKRKNKKTHRK